MAETPNLVLTKMLDRLFASMVNGPAMNCRPHASRQRVDLAQFERLKDRPPGEILLALLGPDAEIKIAARAPAPTKAANLRVVTDGEGQEELSPEEQAARRAWLDQQALLGKVRVIADDARTYEQDTGVYALNIGFPLLSLPPGTFGGRAGLASRRVLAPIALIPVTLTIRSGTRQSIELACRADGVDRVSPNLTLLAWLEQQTGRPLPNPFDDEQGQDPWREVAELVRAVAAATDVKAPELFAAAALPPSLALTATPKADQDESGPSIVPAAVIGLFPSSNQGLLNDTRDLLAAGVPDGPLQSFVRHGVSLDAPPAVATAPAVPDAAPAVRRFAQERLVTAADPCQARAVRLSRTSTGLVVHGPPGTGKSQTIANVIGDHLARGERVLFVCDKRTALDVVADRLATLGLGDLFATVHDPQRDQKELYRSVREQLDNLADTPLKPDTEAKLKRVDAELQTLHDDLSHYYRDLVADRGGPGSFHHLVGQWLDERGEAGNAADWDSLQKLQVADFERHQVRLKEVLERGERVGYATNPWKKAAGIDLRGFLSRPMDSYREAVGRCGESATAADATIDPLHPPFDPGADPTAEAARRREVAGELEALRDLPPAVALRWLARAPGDGRKVLAELDAMTDALAEVGERPLDPALTHVPASATAAEDGTALLNYAAAFEARLAAFRRLRAALAAVPQAVLLRWMKADPKMVAAARKRLESAAPLAAAVEGGVLDASLLARYEAAPFEPAKVFEALAALGAYLDIAGKWTAIFHGAKKKAADPIVRHFGLSLSPASAGEVRQFLTDRQKRSDLRAAVEGATGEPFANTPDDGELLEVFTQHRAAVVAVTGDAAAAGRGAGDGSADAAEVAAVNDLLGAAAAPAGAILSARQLPTGAAAARRLAGHLQGLEARRGLRDWLAQVGVERAAVEALDDAGLLSTFALVAKAFALLCGIDRATPLGAAVATALATPAATPGIVAALRRSPERAAAVLKALGVWTDTGLFMPGYLKAVRAALWAGKPLSPVIAPLAERLPTLEGVLRVREGLVHLPAELSAAAAGLLAASASAVDGFSAIRRNVLAGEIVRRLGASPHLQTIDGHRLQSSFDRYRHLSDRKKDLVRDLIQHHWVSRQKERLVASTGTRLNAAATDLRRRLTSRGERAMRLRQVIARGGGIDGGDPLFDLRPIWMASPETVAQLFPRQPLFDVVIFDEASQCRLEEALPVLTRAKRVVIAGDPKQLPPTRFFESGVVTTEDTDAETDDELFVAQQGDVEDLLTASLGLDVHQCYLDVHYRSRNADLIGFSNEHFYGSRLQAIPGHPRNRTRYAPITLYRADGVYEKRRNPIEADQVCKIVRDLLKRAAPPSIGIACFNLVQRDLIVEKLEDLAGADPEFAARLTEARERRGAGSFEGLFVKNLENVQGDERDHLIISTTYGPDPVGRFRRSFGPLGTAGGGRRLNVLVTRARAELHVVTSIPRTVYQAMPPVPAGSTPSGAWLLFTYLAYAEQLQQEYELNHRILENAGPTDRAAVTPRPTRTPSLFAKALATRLAASHHHGSHVHWGNEGFNIDLAVTHPTRAEDVTVGVLCDMTRFAGSDDPVEWDVFRTAVHESQGWRLHRVWTPHFFRDPNGSLEAIVADIERTLTAESDQDRGTSGETAAG